MLWLLSLSLSVDALAVSIAYGLKSTRIPITSKLIICALSVFYFGIAVWFGTQISRFFSPETAKIIGIVLMSAICLWMLLQVLFNKTSPEDGEESIKTLVEFSIKSIGLTFQIIRNPMLCDMDNSNTIGPIEALFLGTALSVDAISIGIGYSLSGMVNPFTPLAVGCVQFLFLCLGNFIGLKCHSSKPRISDKLQIVSVLIIFILILVRIFN